MAMAGHGSSPPFGPGPGLAVRLCCNVVLSITGTAVLGISAQMKTFGWIATPVVLLILGGDGDGEQHRFMFEKDIDIKISDEK